MGPPLVDEHQAGLHGNEQIAALQLKGLIAALGPGSGCRGGACDRLEQPGLLFPGIGEGVRSESACSLQRDTGRYDLPPRPGERLLPCRNGSRIKVFPPAGHGLGRGTGGGGVERIIGGVETDLRLAHGTVGRVGE